MKKKRIGNIPSGKLRIFLSPTAYEGGGSKGSPRTIYRGRARDFFKSQSLYVKREFGIFPSPASLGFIKGGAVGGRWNSEFFYLGSGMDNSHRVELYKLAFSHFLTFRNIVEGIFRVILREFYPLLINH